MTTAQMVIGLLFVSLMIFLLTRSPKNLRSSLLLLPTQRQRQIKVISYFLFPIAWLAAVGILTVCSAVVRSSFSQHYPLYRSFYPLVIFFLFTLDPNGTDSVEQTHLTNLLSDIEVIVE